MVPKTKKIILILIPIIIVLIVIISLLILYLSTDFLKSNKTLFFKYAVKNIEKFEEILSLQDEENFYNTLSQNKYEISSEFTINYIENSGGSTEDTSNEINNLKLVLDGQTDSQNKYNYKDIQLLFGDEKYLELEYIQNDNVYGIKFTDLVNQFLSIENTNLKEVAQSLGMSEEYVNKVPNNLEEIDLKNIFTFSNEQYESLKSTYLTALSSVIDNNNFSKQKNVSITIDEVSVYANGYTLTLTKEQYNNIIIQLLQQIRDDQTIKDKVIQILEFFGTDTTNFEQDYTTYINEQITIIQNNNIGIDEIKFTIYESNGEVVQTVVEESGKSMTISFKAIESGNSIIIDANNSGDEEEFLTLNIEKSTSSTEDKLYLAIEKIVGSAEENFEFYRNKTISESIINIDTEFTYEDINSNQIKYAYIEDINLVSEFDEIIELDDSNNIILNNCSQEQIDYILNVLDEQYKAVYEEKVQQLESMEFMLGNNLFNNEASVNIEPETMSTQEINRFNSKYEFYTGQEVSKENVTALLDVVKSDLARAQVSYSENETSTSTSNNKTLQSIRLTIENGTENSELAESVKELIDSEVSSNKTFNVSIQYDETTSIVSYITLTVNE